MKLNSFQLKWIAIITMLIDHIGAVLLPEYVVLRCIGRLSFPIFCFLLTEGFFYTRNVERYIVRLAVFAIISEIPYDLAFLGKFVDFRRQNVFFTLCVGMIMMYAIKRTNNLTIKAVYLVLAMWGAQILGGDYGYKGILLIAIYCFFREQKTIRIFLGAVWNFIGSGVIQQFGVFAAVPLLLYSGEKGKSMKYVFYVFYPVHLLILYIISAILNM